MIIKQSEIDDAMNEACRSLWIESTSFHSRISFIGINAARAARALAKVLYRLNQARPSYLGGTYFVKLIRCLLSLIKH